MTAVSLMSGGAMAVGFNASADFLSAYVARGGTYNDGPVLQLSAEVAKIPLGKEYGTLALGTWANYDISDYSSPSEYPRAQNGIVSEVDYYLTYCLPVKVVDLSVTYIEYTYPHDDCSSDKEVIVRTGKALGDTGLYVAFASYFGVGGFYDESLYLKAGLHYKKSLTKKLTGKLGTTAAYDLPDGQDDGFREATVYAGLSYALTEHFSLNSTFTYVAQLGDEVLSDAAYDTQAIGSIGVSCSF